MPVGHALHVAVTVQVVERVLQRHNVHVAAGGQGGVERAGVSCAVIECCICRAVGR